MALQLSSVQMSDINRLETQLETGFTTGAEQPMGVNVIPGLINYDQPMIVKGVDQTGALKPKIKAAFKALIAALMLAWEDWNEVVSMSNSWVSYDNGVSFTTPAYRRSFLGQVYLKGLVKSGTVSYTSTGQALQLPAGYRPNKTMIFIVMSNDTVGQVRIGADGWIIITPPSNSAWVSFDGISFRAEQ
jgi:hypothetical protein